MKKFALILIILLGLVFAGHFVLAALGGVVAITTMVWFLLVASVIGSCAAILLLFILTGIGAFVLGTILFVWTIIAVALFPIMFPILIPLLIIFLFIFYLRRKQKNS